MRSSFALVALLVGLAVLSPSAHGAATPDTEGGPRVTMFGDSIAGSLEYVPEALEYLSQGIDLRTELMPCRKLVPLGCAYMGGRPPSVLAIVKASTFAQLGNIVIVNVGYNDPANNYETDMAQVANALAERGIAHIIWVTLREKTDDYRTINAVISSQAPRWPQMQIADWEAASSGKDWFNPDGLHLNAAGAMGLATLLRPYVLTACGAACEPAGPPAALAPRYVRRPALGGTPIVGRVLTCRPGSWTGTTPIVFSFRWLRNNKVIAGIHGRSRQLGTADRGRLVACRVWAANAKGATQATSKALRVRAAS
jgi:hypothetical protein